MATKPKVSIISISYNQERYIRQALEGFVAQETDFDFEVIIGDDHSTDKTPEIITEFQERYPKIFKPILRKKNVGTVPNIVDVLQQTTGEYIAICEGDDYWTDPHKLQTQVDYLESHPKYAGCFHTVRVVFEGNAKDDYIFPEVEDPAWYTLEELLKTNYIPTNSVLYRRQDYSKLPTNIMPFDWFFHLFHAQFGTIGFLDQTMSVYRKHEGGVWWDYDINRNKTWQKHGLSYLALLHELLKIYGKNDTYRQIIQDTIFKMFGALIDVDKAYDSQLLEQALATYPEQIQPLLVEQHRQLQQASEERQDLVTQLLKTGDERHAAQLEAGELQNELDRTTARLRAVTSTKTWRLRNKAAGVKRRLARKKS